MLEFLVVFWLVCFLFVCVWGCLFVIVFRVLAYLIFLPTRKSMKQSPSAGVHTFCDRQKPLPDGAAQYYVAGRAQPVLAPNSWLDAFWGSAGGQPTILVKSKGFRVIDKSLILTNAKLQQIT